VPTVEWRSRRRVEMGVLDVEEVLLEVLERNWSCRAMERPTAPPPMIACVKSAEADGVVEKRRWGCGIP